MGQSWPYVSCKKRNRGRNYAEFRGDLCLSIAPHPSFETSRQSRGPSPGDSQQALDLFPNALCFRNSFGCRARFGGVTDLSLSPGLPKPFGISSPATHDLRASTKNSFSLRNRLCNCKRLTQRRE